MPYMSAHIAKQLAINPIALNNIEHLWSNLPTASLYEHALRNKEAHLTRDGSLLVRHAHDNERPLSTYIVDDPLIDCHTEHGEFQQHLSESQFEALFDRMRAYLNGRALYVEDCLIAAQSGYQQPMRLISPHAWHALFAKTMFASSVDTTQTSEPGIDPDNESKNASQASPFTLIHAAHFCAVPSRDGIDTEAFMVLNIGLRIALIGGTAYAGAIKTTAFAMMAHALADSDVLPLHAAAYGAADGAIALLLGPEASGKTTLASNSAGSLFGDDALGWSEQHIFNFEAGCYARVNKLDAENEPLIYTACQSFGSILENAAMDMQQRQVSFDEHALSSNARAAFAITGKRKSAADSSAMPAILSRPKHLVLLACDAFGVLPAISRLSVQQLMYYYLLGYASHPREGAEPESTFSPCCGMPLMAHHPAVYAKILAAKVRQEKTQCWLLNTGWSGGPAGIGERMSIGLTRTLLHAALNGSLNELDYQTHPVLGLQMPAQLDPISTWYNQDDEHHYSTAAKQLAEKLKTAFIPFADQMPADVFAAGSR